MTGTDCASSLLQGCRRSGKRIQPQAALSTTAVGTVAQVALLNQNWFDVKIKINQCRQWRRVFSNAIIQAQQYTQENPRQQNPLPESGYTMIHATSHYPSNLAINTLLIQF